MPSCSAEGATTCGARLTGSSSRSALGVPVRIETRCPASGTPIEVAATQDGVERVEPSGAVMSAVVPTSIRVCCVADTRGGFCDFVNFYLSDQVAGDAMKGRGAAVLSMDWVFALAGQLMLPLKKARACRRMKSDLLGVVFLAGIGAAEATSERVFTAGVGEKDPRCGYGRQPEMRSVRDLAVVVVQDGLPRAVRAGDDDGRPVAVHATRELRQRARRSDDGRRGRTARVGAFTDPLDRVAAMRGGLAEAAIPASLWNACLCLDSHASPLGYGVTLHGLAGASEMPTAASLLGPASPPSEVVDASSDIVLPLEDAHPVVLQMATATATNAWRALPMSGVAHGSPPALRRQ